MTSENNVIVHQMAVGPMGNFIYFIGDASTKDVAVVDPAWDVDALRDAAKANGWQIRAVFLTHGHPDHVNGLEELLSTHDIPVYLSEKEAPFYTPECRNLKTVRDGEILKIGGVPFDCVYTPGHTPGCQCFRHDNILITGDTLFINGCGRCDLPGGDAQTMYRSLYEVISPMPDSVVIYPGHDYGPTPTDSLGGQKKTNPYLLCHSIEEFLTERMG